jgi:hypothetical protein
MITKWTTDRSFKGAGPLYTQRGGSPSLFLCFLCCNRGAEVTEITCHSLYHWSSLGVLWLVRLSGLLAPKRPAWSQVGLSSVIRNTLVDGSVLDIYF